MGNKILVADDDPLERSAAVDYIRDEFSGREIEILQAGNRNDALTIIRELRENIAVVVTDIFMPEIEDGNAVASEALDLGIAVIVLSSVPEGTLEDIRPRCLAVLNKITREGPAIGKLVEIIRRALDMEVSS